MESSEERLMARRASLKDIDDLLDPLYQLGEKKMKFLDFLSKPIDNFFEKKFSCLRVNNEDYSDPSSLWCNLELE